MKKLKTRELVELSLEGNERAMSALLERERPKMVYLMRKQFKNLTSDMIEDSIQTSMMKAYVKFDKYNPEYSFNTWLRRICTNTIIDICRTKQFKTSFVSIDKEDTDEEGTVMIRDILPSYGLKPDEEFENAEKSEFIKKIFSSKKIPTLMLKMANLYYIEQMSYEEVAKKTNKPLGTIKANLFNFRKITKKENPLRV
jgi:RNA polymerase sigma-70 factor (ECF subfamily)